MISVVLTAVVLASSPPLVTGAGVVLDEQGRPSWTAPFVGVQLDAAAPDGLGASLVVSPGRFLRISAGAVNNGVGTGMRLGLMLVGFPRSVFRPTLSVDGGYVWGGRGQWVPQLIQDEVLRLAVTGADVAFANAQLGFELGSPHFAVFLRAGLSYVGVALEGRRIELGDTATLTLGGVGLMGFLPSARLGFIILFG